MKSRTFPLLGLIVAGSAAVIVAAGPSAPGRGVSTHDRIVRVVTISQNGLERGAHDLLESTLARLDLAAAFHPDIAVLPELFSNHAPESVSGPVTERLAAWARSHSSYVIFGLETKNGGQRYNSAILLDRQGQVLGQYNDSHPDGGQIKAGMTPAKDTDPAVFKTDFGMIGIQTLLRRQLPGRAGAV